MKRTVGYHIVISGYGLWLPGDDRGFWSTAWDEQIGLIEPHVLHPGDPVRVRMSRERMNHPPVKLNSDMLSTLTDTLAECTASSDWSIAAASVETTHSHLLLTYTERNIERSVKWIKDRTTKAIHRDTSHHGPVWCKGKWRSFIFDLDLWENSVEYIEKHNVRRGAGPRPYQFITADIIP